LQVIGDQIKLLAGHAEGGMLVNVHGRKIAIDRRLGNGGMISGVK
jgi:hypothetical protein